MYAGSLAEMYLTIVAGYAPRLVLEPGFSASRPWAASASSPQTIIGRG
ncbi:hypothetical protein GCM10010425_84390 [Streptomyces spororaveus]|uniref:Uncharacterized protein n=1 Tax=Streptomyces spororaveus TaxID=284039 RepID=A0ABQ3T6M6_9ACTN|nr:hypothetical protein Sspor_15870 [Streptomyces spororaveus]